MIAHIIAAVVALLLAAADGKPAPDAKPAAKPGMPSPDTNAALVQASELVATGKTKLDTVLATSDDVKTYYAALLQKDVASADVASATKAAMGRRKNKGSLKAATAIVIKQPQFSDVLLYDASGKSMGEVPWLIRDDGSLALLSAFTVDKGDLVKDQRREDIAADGYLVKKGGKWTSTAVPPPAPPKPCELALDLAKAQAQEVFKAEMMELASNDHFKESLKDIGYTAPDGVDASVALKKPGEKFTATVKTAGAVVTIADGSAGVVVVKDPCKK